MSSLLTLCPDYVSEYSNRQVSDLTTETSTKERTKDTSDGGGGGSKSDRGKWGEREGEGRERVSK